jgi:hypothetical protein
VEGDIPSEPFSDDD